METSRKYYEYKLRDFKKYVREQFCKDEGIDYKWIVRAKKEYVRNDSEQYF